MLGSIVRLASMARIRWPSWWEWELEFTPHLERRMEDRAFTETDLRRMLEIALDYAPDPAMDGRFLIKTRHGRGDWEVIVEPDAEGHCLVVVTAYPL
jgi:hypothetical protein